MKKKTAFMLTGVIAISLLAGCGSNSDTGTTVSSSAAPVETTAAPTAEVSNSESSTETDTASTQTETADSNGMIDDSVSGTLEVYGWTTDPEYQIAAFEKAYPNVTVNYTQIGTDYDVKMQTLVQNETDGPDVFYSDVKNVKLYINLGAWDNLSADPYNADTSDMEDYTVSLGSDDDGNLRAMSYQATPGGFWYKRDLAKKYLGTDDPDEISQMMSTVNGMLDVAEKIKTGSNDQTHMFASNNDLWQFANYGIRKTAWVDADNNFVMDDYIPEYFDLAKKVRDNDYDAGLDAWSDAWYASCADDSVFGYAEPTWGLQYVIMTGAPDSKGNWGLASLPASYFNGGSYLGIYTQAKNKDLAWLYIQFVCGNHEYLKQYVTDKGDFTNSKTVNQEVAADYAEPWCNGQNTFAFFEDQISKINTSIVTQYDDQIGNLMLNNVKLYITGEADKDTAIQQFKDDVATNYRGLNVQ